MMSPEGKWTMATVDDVAAYVMEKQGAMTAMKLQKLVYYVQAWSLVWDERALFPERLEAWADGPVCPTLYRTHRGQFQLSGAWPEGDAGALDTDGRETIDAVLEFYGDKSAQWLSDLTHSERPWVEARGDLSTGEPSNSEITHASMAEYYSALDATQSGL